MNDNFLTEKVLTGENVLRAAIARIEWIFETFPSVCLSFSGGKDSTVLFHLLADVARRKKRRFSVLFIDWEAQYQCTIEHIQKMREMYHDVTETFYWVALPLTTAPEILDNMIRQYFSQERAEEETIQALNHLRRVLHEVSPFAQEPVDCVLWVKADEVVANDYNPNVMAPGEKKLLKQSLEKDGFTQPVVVSEEKNHYLVVDGFHRQLLGREAGTGERLKG